MGALGVHAAGTLGSNGSNAARPCRPQGSTLTFQPRAGVPWVHGLRHGVTMHPRGRHLREGRIPWPHGTRQTLAREQLPTQPLQQHYQYRRRKGSEGRSLWKQVMIQHNHYNPAQDRRKRREICQHQCNVDERMSKNHNRTSNNGNNEDQLHNNYNTILLRDASQESSIACTSKKSGEFNLVVGPKTAMHMDNAKAGWVPSGHGAIRCRSVTGGEISRQKTRIIIFPSDGKQQQQL